MTHRARITNILIKIDRTSGRKIGVKFFFISLIGGFVSLYSVAGVEKVGIFFGAFVDVNSNELSFLILKVAVIITGLFYTLNVFNAKMKANMFLILIFTSFILFVPGLLFYMEWKELNYRSDGQLAMSLMIKPIISCWIYPVLGIVHDAINGSVADSNASTVN